MYRKRDCGLPAKNARKTFHCPDCNGDFPVFFMNAIQDNTSPENREGVASLVDKNVKDAMDLICRN